MKINFYIFLFLAISAISNMASAAYDLDQIQSAVDGAYSLAKFNATNYPDKESNNEFVKMESQLRNMLVAKGVSPENVKGHFEKWTSFEVNGEQNILVDSVHMIIKSTFKIYSSGSNYYNRKGADIEMTFNLNDNRTLHFKILNIFTR